MGTIGQKVVVFIVTELLDQADPTRVVFTPEKEAQLLESVEDVAPAFDAMCEGLRAAVSAVLEVRDED